MTLYFLARWDSVLTGMVNEQNKTLEDLFHKQIKKHRPLSHDLDEYERAEEGTEKRPCQFLMGAARDQCRERDFLLEFLLS